MPSLRLLCVFTINLFIGCASVPPWQPPVGHPANPETVQSPAPLQSHALKRYDTVFGTRSEASQPPTLVEHVHPGQAAAPPGGEWYTCPMHPEVVQSGPGRCPICNMQLVPKKTGEGGRP